MRSPFGDSFALNVCLFVLFTMASFSPLAMNWIKKKSMFIIFRFRDGYFSSFPPSFGSNYFSINDIFSYHHIHKRTQPRTIMWCYERCKSINISIQAPTIFSPGSEKDRKKIDEFMCVWPITNWLVFRTAGDVRVGEA